MSIGWKWEGNTKESICSGKLIAHLGSSRIELQLESFKVATELIKAIEDALDHRETTTINGIKVKLEDMTKGLSK